MKKSPIILMLLLFFSSVLKAQEIKNIFSKTIKNKIEMGYVLDLPQNQKEKFPLIVFLHGSGERGTDLELVKTHSPFTYKNLFPSPYQHDRTLLLYPRAWRSQSLYCRCAVRLH